MIVLNSHFYQSNNAYYDVSPPFLVTPLSVTYPASTQLLEKTPYIFTDIGAIRARKRRKGLTSSTRENLISYRSVGPCTVLHQGWRKVGRLFWQHQRCGDLSCTIASLRASTMLALFLCPGAAMVKVAYEATNLRPRRALLKLKFKLKVRQMLGPNGLRSNCPRSCRSCAEGGEAYVPHSSLCHQF